MSTETKSRNEYLGDIIAEVDKLYKDAGVDGNKLDLLKFKRDLVLLTTVR